jgi:hypothetical protein
MMAGNGAETCSTNLNLITIIESGTTNCVFIFLTFIERYQILIPAGTLNILRFFMALRRNEYQEYFPGCKGGRCLGLMSLPFSRDDCLAVLGTSNSGLSRPVHGLP